MSGNPTIRYRFDLPDGGVRTLDFFFDAVDFKMQEDPVGARPFWTELGFCRCTNCPLDAASVEHCPAASRMAPAVEQLEALASFDTVGVTVTESGRTVHVETSAQEAMSSVIGLIMATAGCPWTDHLRPMARFHLPFASEAETMYRSVSMYLLARELMGESDETAYDALKALYENLHVVNRGIAKRLGAATRTDPARNAIAILDTYTTSLPAALARSLDELEPLFDAWRAEKKQVI